MLEFGMKKRIIYMCIFKGQFLSSKVNVYPVTILCVTCDCYVVCHGEVHIRISI